MQGKSTAKFARSEINELFASLHLDRLFTYLIFCKNNWLRVVGLQQRLDASEVVFVRGPLIGRSGVTSSQKREYTEKGALYSSSNASSSE